MKKINPDLVRVEDMLGMIAEIEIMHGRGVSGNTEFFAIAYCLAVIGEAARHISDAARRLEPEIPWRQMADMRNRIIHGYGKVDRDIVMDVVTRELPGLKCHLQALLAKLS